MKGVNDGHPIHSDGNGIIIDDFRNTQYSSTYGKYTPTTLVENNLVIGNGGAGIHIFLTDNVTTRNNTVFNNCLDPIGLGTWRGNLNVVNGSNEIFANNISVTNATAINTFNATNFALMDASTNSSNIGNVWINNLSFNGTVGQPSVFVTGSPSVINSTNGNKLGVNPYFTDPSSGNFTLRSISPAIDAASTIYGIPTDDLNNNTRPIGNAADLGAYEYTSAVPTSTPTPTGIAKIGDVNGDGRVDIIDIGIIIDNYGKSPIPNPKADLNGDGVVDIVDIGIVVDHYITN